jgi:hypothetical protein
MTTKPKTHKLDTHEMAWVFEWAHEGCCKSIEEIENEIIHLTTFDGPIPKPHLSPELRDRTKRLAHMRERLIQYRRIESVIYQLRESIAQKSAQEFAEAFVKTYL